MTAAKEEGFASEDLTMAKSLAVELADLEAALEPFTKSKSLPLVTSDGSLTQVGERRFIRAQKVAQEATVEADRIWSERNPRSEKLLQTAQEAIAACAAVSHSALGILNGERVLGRSTQEEIWALYTLVGAHAKQAAQIQAELAATEAGVG